MNKKPLLTIAIPTYNRVKTLEKIIQSLKKEQSDDFILLISDDKSPDGTKKMVSKYLKNTPNLIYHQNENNLGFSGNVCKVYEMAQTKYVWFCCDDDIILPGSVSKVVASLKKHKPVAAVLNCRWVNPYGQEVTAGVEKDKIYNKVNELVDYQPLMRATFLSIVIVKKNKSIEPLKQTDYKDNIFFQLTLVLYLLSEEFKYAEIGVTAVLRKVGFKYGEFFKFNLVDHLKAVYAIDTVFDNQKFITWSKERIFTNLQLYLSQKLGLFKYNGRPTKNTLTKIIKYYGISSLLIFSFKLIYWLVPAFLMKWLYFMRLLSLHGIKKGGSIYKSNINRAFKDQRRTGFTAYK